MRSSVCPALTTAAIVHGLNTDHDRRRGQRCTVLTHPVSLIHRGISVQINRATSEVAADPCHQLRFELIRSKVQRANAQRIKRLVTGRLSAEALTLKS